MAVYTANDIENGSYAVTLDTGTDTINVERSVLTSSDGHLSLKLTFADAAFAKAYAGEEDRASSDTAGQLAIETADDGTGSVTIPLHAVGSKFYVSLQQTDGSWVQTQMTVQADSLPEGAVKSTASEAYTKADLEKCPLSDGVYNVAVRLEGGSGRASIQSPVSVSVEDGKATADIVWSSNHYDYMIVNGDKYRPVNTEGNSEFQIPVVKFNKGYTVIADTTAMSKPYEIEYTLTFDTSSAELTEKARSETHPGPVLAGIGIAVVAVIAVISYRQERKMKSTADK